MMRNIPGRCLGSRDIVWSDRRIGMLFEATDGEHKGVRLPLYINLESEESLRFLKRTLSACGWDGRTLSDLRGIDRPVMLAVDEERDSRGVPRLRLRWVNAMATANVRDSLRGDELPAFLAHLDRRLGELDAGEPEGRPSPVASAPAPGPRRSEPTSEPGTDIPF